MLVPEPDLAAPDQANPSAKTLSANSLATGGDPVISCFRSWKHVCRSSIKLDGGVLALRC